MRLVMLNIILGRHSVQPVVRLAKSAILSECRSGSGASPTPETRSKQRGLDRPRRPVGQSYPCFVRRWIQFVSHSELATT